MLIALEVEGSLGKDFSGGTLYSEIVAWFEDHCVEPAERVMWRYFFGLIADERAAASAARLERATEEGD